MNLNLNNMYAPKSWELRYTCRFSHQAGHGRSPEKCRHGGKGNFNWVPGMLLLILLQVCAHHFFFRGNACRRAIRYSFPYPPWPRDSGDRHKYMNIECIRLFPCLFVTFLAIDIIIIQPAVLMGIHLILSYSNKGRNHGARTTAHRTRMK